MFMITKHIPNTITSLNLFSGSVGVVMAFQANYQIALACMLLAAVFDFCDGLSARALHAYSSIGKELDSLADVVSFGFLPATMVYQMLTVASDNAYLPFAAYIITVFSALRLAKFNVDERQTSSFIGLATPANAIFWAGLAASYHQYAEAYPYAVIILILLMSFLLVAEIPFFSLKFKNLKWKDNSIRFIFLIISVVLLLVLRLDAFMWIILAYILMAFGAWGMAAVKNKK